MTAPHVVVDLDATLDEFHDVLEEMEPGDDEVNFRPRQNDQDDPNVVNQGPVDNNNPLPAGAAGGDAPPPDEADEVELEGSGDEGGELNDQGDQGDGVVNAPPCLLYTSPSPRDGLLSRMPSSA